jgi:hypothetical protein
MVKNARANVFYLVWLTPADFQSVVAPGIFQSLLIVFKIYLRSVRVRMVAEQSET